MKFAHLAICLLLLSFAAVPASAQSDDCSAASLTGAYGYSLKGTVYDRQFNTYLIGAVGRLVADGNGTLTGSDTVNFDGETIRRQLTGTYTVNADCTGALSFSSPGGGLTTMDFVITDDGKIVELVQTDYPYILTGTMRRQKTPVATPAPTPTPAQ